MTPLPPLPLFHHPDLAPEGAFIIDNSSIELMRCPRLFEYKFLRKRELSASRAGRNFGSTLHRGLETRYKICGSKEVSPEADIAIKSAMRDWLKEHPQPTLDFRDFNHACLVMDVYNRNYRNEPFRILPNPKNGNPIVECSFALPFGSVQGIKIFYAGKIDLGIEDNNGIWSHDHKTAFQFGDTFSAQMNRDGGQLGYVWALSKVLGVRPAGYIIDAIRIRRAKRGDEYSGTAPCDETDLVRTPYAVSDESLELWQKDVLSIINHIFNLHASGHFPEYRWQCTNKFGKCDFYDACSVPFAQRDMLLYESTLFEESDWTPLNLPEEKENKENKN